MSQVTDASAVDIDPQAIREGFLDAVFDAAATIGASLGVSGRALYESIAPLADDTVALAHALWSDQLGASKQTIIMGATE